MIHDGVDLVIHADFSWYEVKKIKETNKAYLFEMDKCVNPNKTTRFWCPKKVIEELKKGETSYHVELPISFDFAKYITRIHHKG